MEREEISTLREILTKLEEMCAMKLQGLIRVKSSPSKGIRFKFKELKKANAPAIVIHEISPRGIEILRQEKEKKIALEIIGQKERVNFDSSIMTLHEDYLLLSLPQLISSQERRKNSRFDTTRKTSAFCRILNYEFDPQNIGAPPLLPLYAQLASLVRVNNLSSGGFLLETHYPDIYEVFLRLNNIAAFELIFPDQEPFTVTCEVAWMKKVKDQIKNREEGVEKPRIQVRFLIGMKILEPDDLQLQRIESFINHLSVSAAI
jgi:hypothetical protein